MKKFFLTFVVVSMTILSARADEGMWVMGCMSQKADSILRSLGLELEPQELYSDNGPSLNNAVVQLGGFCSGVVVSDQGLMLTNHHCGFGAIHEHSSVKHDYLKNGFMAKSLKQELPNEDLYVLFHLRTIDVTDRILGCIPDIAGQAERDSLINSISDELCKEVKNDSLGIFGEVNPFFRGSRYCLSVYQKYDDVRLVAAPPQCLGKFGGETDNWIWPRQTCDFSVFRIYADKNGNPAPYSKKNVPLRPRQYAKVSLEGYRPGDFAMTLGYPGSTDRYMSSYGIMSRMKNENLPQYNCRTVLQDILQRAMNQSDELRIKYADKYVSSANYWKNSLGMNHALTKLNVVGEKQALETKINEWVESDTVAHERYRGMLDALRTYYSVNGYAIFCQTMAYECLRSSDVIRFIMGNMFGRYAGSKQSFADCVNNVYKNIDIDVDKEIYATMLDFLVSQVNDTTYLPKDVCNEVVKHKGFRQYAEYAFENSIFAKPEELAKMKSFEDAVSANEKDPLVNAALEFASYLWKTLPMHVDVNKYEQMLGDALREMNHSHEYYPDANFTLRVSGGICKPIEYAPLPTGQKVATDWRDPNFSCQDLEEAKEWQTSPASLIHKFTDAEKLAAERGGDAQDYTVLPKVAEWAQKGRFSAKYKDSATGVLPLCFLTTNDITGGNSGSGVYDSKGRLIGLAFDGNWEAMSGDIKFNNQLQRCINVDIRYVLSVIEDYLGGKRLIKEINL